VPEHAEPLALAFSGFPHSTSRAMALFTPKELVVLGHLLDQPALALLEDTVKFST
jgi:hypothetical protein